jgi:hypothetical protein
MCCQPADYRPHFAPSQSVEARGHSTQATCRGSDKLNGVETSPKNEAAIHTPPFLTDGLEQDWKR